MLAVWACLLPGTPCQMHATVHNPTPRGQVDRLGLATTLPGMVRAVAASALRATYPLPPHPPFCTCPPGKTSHPIPMNPFILLKAVHPPSHRHEPGSPTSVDRGALFALWKRSRCISFCRLSCGPDPLISVHFGFVFDLRCGIVFVLRFVIATEAIRPYGL